VKANKTGIRNARLCLLQRCEFVSRTDSLVSLVSVVLTRQKCWKLYKQRSLACNSHNGRKFLSITIYGGKPILYLLIFYYELLDGQQLKQKIKHGCTCNRSGMTILG
jgi:hypothetical protein